MARFARRVVQSGNSNPYMGSQATGQFEKTFEVTYALAVYFKDNIALFEAGLTEGSFRFYLCNGYSLVRGESVFLSFSGRACSPS